MHNSEIQPTKSGFWVLMRNRAFVNLWAGQIISQVADKIFFVLLIALVAGYQPPKFLENLARASVMVANTLPAVFLGSVAGVFVDRWSKKQILWLSNFGRGLLILLIPFLPKHLFFLLIVAVLESILTQFFAPAEQSSIPILVERNNLMTANALFTTTMMGSLVVGFAIGDPLLRLSKTIGGEHGGEFLVSILYLVAALVLALTPMKEKREQSKSDLHPWRDFKQGLAYLKSNKVLSRALIQITILYCVFAALMVLALSLAKDINQPAKAKAVISTPQPVVLVSQTQPTNDRLSSDSSLPSYQAPEIPTQGMKLSGLVQPNTQDNKGDRTGNGGETQGFFLVAAMGVGLILGAGMLGHWGERLESRPLPAVGFFLMGAVLLAFSLAQNLWLLLMLSVGLGIGASLVGVPMQTLIQIQTPAEMRGKVFGVQNNIVNIALSLPLTIVAVLTDVLGSSRVVLFAIGLLVVLSGYWSWVNRYTPSTNNEF
jgi:MFS family permease